MTVYIVILDEEIAGLFATMKLAIDYIRHEAKRETEKGIDEDLFDDDEDQESFFREEIDRYIISEHTVFTSADEWRKPLA